jgi:hypothetical protein
MTGMLMSQNTTAVLFGDAERLPIYGQIDPFAYMFFIVNDQHFHGRPPFLRRPGSGAKSPSLHKEYYGFPT